MYFSLTQVHEINYTFHSYKHKDWDVSKRLLSSACSMDQHMRYWYLSHFLKASFKRATTQENLSSGFLTK